MDKLEITQVVERNLRLYEVTMRQTETGKHCPDPQSLARRRAREVGHECEDR